jgi:hypothetical protein
LRKEEAPVSLRTRPIARLFGGRTIAGAIVVLLSIIHRVHPFCLSIDSRLHTSSSSLHTQLHRPSKSEAQRIASHRIAIFRIPSQLQLQPPQKHLILKTPAITAPLASTKLRD